MILSHHNQIDFLPALGGAKMTHTRSSRFGSHPHAERHERFKEFAKQATVPRDRGLAGLPLEKPISVDPGAGSSSTARRTTSQTGGKHCHSSMTTGVWAVVTRAGSP